MGGVSRKIDRFGVVFDDESLVADAGLVAAGVLMSHSPLAALGGQVRERQNWIGGSEYTPIGSQFVPPLYLVGRLWRGSVGAGCSPRRVGL